MTEFAAEVESIVGPTLADLGFTFDAVDDYRDEGGRRVEVVYYRSSDCKIQIYSSSREGSINCMIAPLGASNEFGLKHPSSEWQFLKRFSSTPRASLEELAKSASYEQLPDHDLLEKVRKLIADYYDDAHAGIIEMYGNG